MLYENPIFHWERTSSSRREGRKSLVWAPPKTGLEGGGLVATRSAVVIIVTPRTWALSKSMVVWWVRSHKIKIREKVGIISQSQDSIMSKRCSPASKIGDGDLDLNRLPIVGGVGENQRGGSLHLEKKTQDDMSFWFGFMARHGAVRSRGSTHRLGFQFFWFFFSCFSTNNLIKQFNFKS